jgi:hypothetical protein
MKKKEFILALPKAGRTGRLQDTNQGKGPREIGKRWKGIGPGGKGKGKSN